MRRKLGGSEGSANKEGSEAYEQNEIRAGMRRLQSQAATSK